MYRVGVGIKDVVKPLTVWRAVQDKNIFMEYVVITVKVLFHGNKHLPAEYFAKQII